MRQYSLIVLESIQVNIIRCLTSLINDTYHFTSKMRATITVEGRQMKNKSNNKRLQEAKKHKKDEFYTQLQDIESEIKHYTSHFNNKIVYCNCDNPLISNFFKYFYDNFESLGIKKLIASCYSSDKGNCGRYYIHKKGDEKIPYDEIKPTMFVGDGDFRSQESIDLLLMSDVVVTNPPFSLFREYMSQLIEYGKKFLVIGNINAITYKEIFRLIQNSEVWLGENLGRGISGFIVPEHYELYGTEVYINEHRERIVSPNNCLWLTNLDLPKRHNHIPLTKKYYGNEEHYSSYDNCNAVNVNKTKDIPYDYEGLMGVPITFLHKFSPTQFELVRFRKGDDGKDLSIGGKCPYFRILIRKI